MNKQNQGSIPPQQLLALIHGQNTKNPHCTYLNAMHKTPTTHISKKKPKKMHFVQYIGQENSKIALIFCLRAEKMIQPTEKE
jgi:hypothetical protein